MAKDFSQLPGATAVSDADIIPIMQAGVTKQAAASLIRSLSTTSVVPGTYGSESVIPVLTVDAYGRTTNLTTASVSLPTNPVISGTMTASTGLVSLSTATISGLTVGSISGVLKGTAGVVGAAAAGTDYVAPGGSAGAITVTTAAADTNTTQAASTAFVVGQAGSSSPAMNGTATVGTSLRYSRQDHIHPTDTSRASTTSPVFTGGVTVGGALLVSTGVASLTSASISALTVASLSGLLKGTAGVVGTAVSGTDYLPASNPVISGTVMSSTGLATLTSASITNLTAGNITSIKSLGETQPSSTAGAGATLTLDLSTGTTFLVTFGAGNITGLTLTNVGSVTSFSLRLKQDGTGSRTFSTSGTTVNWPSGTAPTLTTTASKADWLTFVWNGASWDGFVGGQNY